MNIAPRSLNSLSLAATLALGLALATPASAVDKTAAAATATATAPANSGALEVVADLQRGLLDVMRNADTLGFAGRVERLESILDAAFDTNFMAEKSIGRHWKQLSEEEQQRWLTCFRRMTTATYADRFEQGSGTFETLGNEDASHGTVLVRTKLVVPGEEAVEINFRMRETKVGWRVIDVYLNGTVSELALRKADYGTVLKKEGIDGLIAMVDGKTSELAGAGAIQ